MQFSDTIYALSSGKPPAGVAIVRVSGPLARHIAVTLSAHEPRPRIAELRLLRSPDGSPLDRGLVLFFAAPGSFTGEDCVEFHLHGGRAVVASVLAAMSGFVGTRMAEAGEFSRRAFLNGRMDLVEAEALADLIAAETESQRRFALQGAEGLQGGLYASWRKRIVHALAMIEAELDFSDEGDVPGSVAEAVWTDVAELVREISGHSSTFRRSEILREGFRVVILGAPNAGKSSLLNALARRDVAIVTDEPGTTRDLIDVALDLGGMKVIITDTAGLREDAGRVEAIGIERALARARAADVVIRLVAFDQMASGSTPLDVRRGELLVMSKVDLRAVDGVPENRPACDHAVSVVTGVGIDSLLRLLEERARAAVGPATDVLPARFRHVELLKRAGEHLQKALATDASWLELRAEELRRAAKAFGMIAGEIGIEDVLDTVFSEFCIGK